jgi:tyrosyl-tRNA synthetase
MKVLKDEKLIDKFLERGVETIYPSKEALREKLLSGDRLKVYQGYDPSGPYLHVGHAMGIRALRILQQLGHEVIFLVGDFTARIGDPDKDTTRSILSEAQIRQNMEGWKDQAAQLIDFEGPNPVKFELNNKWLSKLNLEDLLELMSKATVQQMIERDLFQKRLDENVPIGLHEFMYPLMQGYDGVAMEVDMEIGGSDQTFNMLMGRNLSKACLGKEKFVRANQMMEAPEGLTMSKTRGNGINLADSPEDMYGKAMSYPDELITKGLELLTDVPMDEIVTIKEDIDQGNNPMKHKKKMAFELVKTVKGEKDAIKAQNHFEATVQGEDLPQNMPEIAVEGATEATEIAKKIAPEMSNSQIRRIIKQGGFSVNSAKKSDPNEQVDVKKGDVIKLGKRNYGKIK